ncbi:Peptidase S8/S53, subtilisin/kexin/sedolisin [Penicillium occitanis (nom. inval.)]|nr:Peptidase S8/S53, subtilisin/kexin/sedolisin [Penicillium occitanis (nom. inval.)]PCG98270.1 hypothetical protein PENOC_063820 [Penicillium occitanis (nom. inval.)]
MDVDETPGLLRSVLGFLARKPLERPIKKPKSLKARRQDAWLRTDAFLQHDADAFDEIEPEQRKRTLHALEGYVEVNPDGESDFNFLPEGPYPKLQALRNMVDSPNSNQGLTIRVSKRSRPRDQIIEEIEHMDRDSKKRRVITREEPSASENFEEADTDFAMLTRRHLVSLDNALRKQWVCVCQKCSGLSVRLSLPQKKDSKVETSFDVFFGVRSVPATSLQEAKITIKDVYNRGRSSSAPVDSGECDFVHICQSITDSLGQQNCLHLALDHGIFQRLRPQPKTFGGDKMSRTMSLAALFKRQQELRGGSSALSLKGKRVLAVTLASALLPFLETPWLQPSFNHSKILFFQPLEDGQLPDITKPFIAMEHIPIITAGKKTGTNVSSSDVSNQSIHPNASVLALGILLCELHYLTSVEHWQKDPGAERNVNTDWYTCDQILKTLEAEAGLDYYLATKACLHWEYLPVGQDAAFESETVQRLFYQNVVKRLESEMFKSWRLRIEDLSSFDSRENENCWGSIGREVVRLETGKDGSPTDTNNGVRSAAQRSMSDSVPASFNSDMVVQKSAQPARTQVTENSTNSLHFFDASHQTGCEQENPLSRKWMDNLLSSIYQFVDPLEPVQAGALQTVEPVRIAILDSGFDPENPLLRDDLGRIDPRIKAAQSFVHDTEPQDIRDEIGHGTHALGLLLKVAPCAEIYIGKIAHRATLNRNTYDDIAKASLAGRAEPPFLPPV